MIEGLECAACGKWTAADGLRNLCPACSGPLLARYDLEALARTWRRADLTGRAPGIWRWREVLPIAPGEEPLTLGEGGTPLLPSRSIGPALGMPRLAFKDESCNPTLSFKARGLAVAIHRARALGALHVAIPSAGNAGSATAAYCAAAGLACTVAMPSDTPAPILDECRAHGARIQLVDGTIADAGAWIRERAAEKGWFDVSTLREPYRLEGKKTMGYELAETGGWRLPGTIVYPTGGGTGLIGMWKAFDELEALGWIGSERPRMISVQASGCAPIVRAFEAGSPRAEPVREPRTAASGLKVPSAIGDFLILAAVRASGGSAVAVQDDELLAGARRLAAQEGIFASPEAGATVAALAGLLESGAIDPEAETVCFVTGHGIKYPVLCGARPAGVSS